jgi:two-component system response regulator PilR (NtrC family)
MASTAEIGRSDLALPEELLQEVEAVDAENVPAPLQISGASALPADLAAYLDGVEREILVRALERHRYNRTAAGASMGLSLRQMRYRMARLGVGVAESERIDPN